MLYKLSISNIKKSFKDYTIYFVTLILGVCIFYIFNSIESQGALKDIEGIEGVKQALGYVSIFVLCVLGFLIIYASNFFIKKRKKEFGIYMMLGMSKRKISYILLLETFFIGIVSLGLGLVIGVALSQITSAFIINLFEMDMSKYSFSFSKEAIVYTIMCYAIIYIMVMLLNTKVVNKNKLIDLINANKKQEKIKVKNVFISCLLFIISVGMILIAYYNILHDPEGGLGNNQNKILLCLFFGTILFFYSLAGIILKVISKCHKFYCNKLNTFVFKQVSGKINTMVAIISIICFMLSATFFLIPIGAKMKSESDERIKKYLRVDFQLIEDIKNSSKDNNALHVNNFIDNNDTLKNNTKDTIMINTYNDNNVTFGLVLGNYKNDVFGGLRFADEEAQKPMDIMSESDYNKMAELLKFDSINLKDDECVIVANETNYIDAYKKRINEDNNIKLFDKDLKIANKITDAFRRIRTFGTYSESGFILVKDSVIKTDDEHRKDQYLMGNYSTQNKELIEDMEEYIRNNTVDYYSEDDSGIVGITKLHEKEGLISDGLTFAFICFYLGITFLISASAILALKNLSDCYDDKEKYMILRRIGADEKDINKALFKQIFIIFMLPFMLAFIHALVGIRLALKIDLFSHNYGVIVATVAVLLLIYGGYFIITYLSSKTNLKNNTV